MHVLAAVVIVLSLSTSARANPEFLPEAIAFGAKDCLFCHTDPGGGRTWNDRGHWLMARKQESGQETVAVSWLEDYVGPSATELSRVAESEGTSTGPRNVPETYHQARSSSLSGTRPRCSAGSTLAASTPPPAANGRSTPAMSHRRSTPLLTRSMERMSRT